MKIIKCDDMKRKLSAGSLQLLGASMIILIASVMLTGCASQSAKAETLAEEALAEGDYSEAIAQFDKVIENADPEDPEDVSLMLEAYYLRADCYVKQGDEDAADKAYAEALAADEANPDAVRTATDYLRMGLAYIRNEDYVSAINAFTNGLEMTEISCEQELMRNLIVCYEKTGDWDSATSQAASYVKKYPDDTEMLQEYRFLGTR